MRRPGNDRTVVEACESFEEIGKLRARKAERMKLGLGASL